MSPPDCDVESGTKHDEAGNTGPQDTEVPVFAEGYDRLAAMMSAHPELAIFRRFGQLSTEMILYYQAEITVLENRLRQARMEDKMSSNLDRQKHNLSWMALAMSSNYDGGTPEREQYEIIMALRELLPRYCANSPLQPQYTYRYVQLKSC
jgi:hypothetical protein